MGMIMMSIAINKMRQFHLKYRLVGGLQLLHLTDLILLCKQLIHNSTVTRKLIFPGYKTKDLVLNVDDILKFQVSSFEFSCIAKHQKKIITLFLNAINTLHSFQSIYLLMRSSCSILNIPLCHSKTTNDRFHCFRETETNNR